MVESRARRRRGSCVADCLPLVFHMVDPVSVFLSKPGMVADGRHEYPGYTPQIADGAWDPLKNSLLMLSLEYGPVYIWLAYQVWQAYEKKRPRPGAAYA